MVHIKGVIAIQIRAAARQALATLNNVRKTLATLEAQVVSLNATTAGTGSGFISMAGQLGTLRAEIASTRSQTIALKNQITALNAAAAKFNTAAAGVTASARAMSAAQNTAGKSTTALSRRLQTSSDIAMRNASQFQWYSRQLMYNWGLPLLMIGGYATKWALETEAAMVKVSKVYGDLNMDPAEKKKQLDALGRYFEAVSNRYGMLQKEVIDIGAMWAQAGAQSVGLAKATKLTVETMILGEMNAEEAAKSLIAIQEAWRLNAAQLTKTIGELNLVENQTAVDMQGLIEAFVRTGSAARVAGLTTGELAALIAGLVPAAGNATVAGNSLKTILSRLAAPTRQAKDAFKELGINLQSTEWRSKGAREQLEILAKSFAKRDKAQKQSLATDIAGRQQYNRFIQLMDALADKNSAYHTALDALAMGKEKVNGVTRRQIQYEQELNQVLQSNPRLMKTAFVQLQNLAIKAIIPLIPYMIALIGYIKQFADWLGAMPPLAQKMIAAFLLFAIGISILSKLVAAFRLLWPVILKLSQFLLKQGKIIFAALVSPWGLAIAAILAIIWLFPEQVGQVVNWFTEIWNSLVTYFSDTNNVFGKLIKWLIDAYWALPESIRNAMQAVVDIVAAAAKAVYELFSYLNPFAHHSPSLVENVTRGMAAVGAAFATIVKIKDPIQRAYDSVKKFKDLMATFRNGKAVDNEFADVLKNIKAVNPKALSTAKDMVNQIKQLQKELDKLQPILDAQQRVVDQWSMALEDANEALRIQQDELDDLEEAVNYYQDLIDNAKNAISDYAATPIKGMQAMQDQIQENTEAQNKLKLAMALMEQQAAGSFGSVADRMAALNGEFETLTANRDELVRAGAGSEILSYYDQQIDAIEAQKDSIYSTSDAYSQMAEELAKLEKQADILDLQKAVNFDPLTYQIDKLANAQEEMSYEDIVNGINNAKQAIEDYTPALDEATAAYLEQQAVVYSLIKARDAIQRTYDAENYKLLLIKRQYDRVADAIAAIRDALQEMGGAAAAANKHLKKTGIKGGGAGGKIGGGYGKSGKIDPKKTFGIKDLEKGTAEMIDALTRGFDQLDFTKPIREAWQNVMKWWYDNIDPALYTISKGIQDWWDSINWDAIFGPIGELLGKIFNDDFKTAWNELVAGIEDFMKNVAPGWKDFWEKIQPVLGEVWNLIQIVAAAIGTVLAAIMKLVLWVWNSVIRPLLSGLGRILSFIGYAFGGIAEVIDGFLSDGSIEEKLNKVVHGLGQFVWGVVRAIMSLIYTVLAMILNLVVNLAKETWAVFSSFFPNLAKAISDWFSGLMQIPWISDFVNMVGQAFYDLWDFLLGHSIIPDIVNGIVGWFTDLVGWALKPVGTVVNGIAGAFQWVWGKISQTDLGKAAQTAVSGIQSAFGSVWSWVTKPFTSAETSVDTSLDNINTSATNAATDIPNIFDTPQWNGISTDISDPFATGATGAQTSFDDIYSGFRGLGGDLNGVTKGTDWKKFHKTMKKYWKDLPKDEKKSTKEIVEDFETMARQIQKSNPKLWDKIRRSISDPMFTAADDVDTSTGDIEDAIKGLGVIDVPGGWKGLKWEIPKPIDSAKNSVKSDVKLMNSSIGDLGANVPKDWKDLKGDIVAPIDAARRALSGMKFKVSGITGPINAIGSAAKKAADRIQTLINKLSALANKIDVGMKNGGAVGLINGIGKTRGLANGGASIGAGGPRDDKILTWLSNGEHVWTSREVDILGGQAETYALRSFIRENNVSSLDLIKAYQNSGFADGGSVLKRLAIPSHRQTATATVKRMDDADNNGVHIEHAHFEFPNIKSPDDAKKFMDNLEALL